MRRVGRGPPSYFRRPISSIRRGRYATVIESCRSQFGRLRAELSGCTYDVRASASCKWRRSTAWSDLSSQRSMISSRSMSDSRSTCARKAGHSWSSRLNDGAASLIGAACGGPRRIAESVVGPIADSSVLPRPA